MKSFTPRPQIHTLIRHSNPTRNPPLLIPFKTTTSTLKHPSSRITAFCRQTNETTGFPRETSLPDRRLKYPEISLEWQEKETSEREFSIPGVSSNGIVMVGAVSVGFLLLFMGMDDQKALALGPEGPLVEEFWDNVRRYALYALTVSTGAIYTVLQPILELLKNPISAILILVIIGGGIYVVSQVLSAMNLAPSNFF
ncbi:hypothetical protein SLA2020_516700 [Shorea laevis]